MQKVLIIFAHPATHKSKINIELIKTVRSIKGVTINDLYENYPDFFINIKREQQLLAENNIIVWHHPMYWYSCPALLKEWIDLVLEHGFAYGRKGNALHGKTVFNAITTGGDAAVYKEGNKNHFSTHQLLAPFQQTAWLCGMKYLPPFVIHSAHKSDSIKVRQEMKKYKQVIIGLRDGTFNLEVFTEDKYLNNLISGE
jgi:glutathione-regulated potassium-efflux system ancillary protein KefG